MSDCIFCKIVKKEIPSKILFENENIMVFEDINKKKKVHFLVIPKMHIECMNDISSENENIFLEILKVIRDETKKLGIDKTGYRVITNTGEDGGQEVNHLHFHVLGGEKI